MRCQHDGAVDRIKLQKDGPKAMAICGEKREKIFFVYSMPLRSFETMNMEEVPVPARIQYMLGPAQGVKNLHGRGFAHGDNRMESMFVISEDPPMAVLGDYHEAVYLPKPTELNPKADEESEQAKRDVEYLGRVYCYLLSPEVRQINGPDWRSRWFQSLDNLLDRDQELGEGLTNVVVMITSMLMEDPARRPPIGEVVDCLSREYKRHSREIVSTSSAEEEDDNA